MTASSLSILGIDPGSSRTGWALVAGTRAAPRLVASGTIIPPARAPFEIRLARLNEGIGRIVAEHGPAEAAVEAPFHGVSARSALQLAHARGVILAVLGQAGVPVHEYAPATIKKAVTGSGRAEKSQVATMVRALLRLRDELGGDDVSDAAAAALCHAFTGVAAHFPGDPRRTPGARR